jgi:signal transduction histidine kinase
MSAAATLVAGSAAAGLLAVPITLAAIRVRSTARRTEAVWFMLFLGAVLAVAITGASAADGPAVLIAAVVLTWAAGAYLAACRAAAAPPWWHAAALALLIAVAACTAAGWWSRRLSVAFAAGVALLAVHPVHGLWTWRRHERGAPGGYLCGLGLLAVAAALLDQVGQNSGGASLPLAAAGGGLVALGAGWWLAERDYLRARAALPAQPPARLEDDGLLQHRLAITGYLTAGVAHEFKNILAHIHTTAEWGAGSGDAARALQLIRSHVGGGVTGVNEMLTTTLNDGPESPSEVAVLSEINKIIGVVASTLHAARVTIRLQVPAELTLVTRKRELMLALLNLIQNAGQATAERNRGGGMVTVTGRREGATCVLEVADAAGGVDPAVVGRIFERGFGTGSGSGLGLYLARSLVERNDGGLSYQEVPGGSCFRIVLPSNPPLCDRAARAGARRGRGGESPG